MVACGASQPRFSQGCDIFHFSSHLDLLRNAKRVIDLDAEIADGAFELSVSKQQLNRSQVPVFL
jgi:hypothetical protein